MVKRFWWLIPLLAILAIGLWQPSAVFETQEVDATKPHTDTASTSATESASTPEPNGNSPEPGETEILAAQVPEANEQPAQLLRLPTDAQVHQAAMAMAERDADKTSVEQMADGTLKLNTGGGYKHVPVAGFDANGELRIREY